MINYFNSNLWKHYKCIPTLFTLFIKVFVFVLQIWIQIQINMINIIKEASSGSGGATAQFFEVVVNEHGDPSQFWVVRQSIICWDHATNQKNGQNGPNGIHILLRRNGHLTSVHLWNCLSTFITKHFLQNLKNSLVAKRTIHGRTLGRQVDWWVAFGDRATVFQQHC